MEQRKPMAVLLIVMGLLILLLVFLSIRKEGKDSPGDERQSVHIELPDAEISDVPDSKSDAYTARNIGRNSRIDEYYDSCEVAWNVERKTVEDPLETVGGGGGGNAQPSAPAEPRSTEDLFGSGTPAQTPQPKPSNPYRETAAQREERHQRRREEAIDMANELSGRESSPAVTGAMDEPAQERIELNPPPASGSRRSGIISSLDGTGGGISSVQNQPEAYSADSEHPFRCVFLKDEKLKSGQRVSVRLLEDMLVGPYVIPKNTHLQAYATIDARLDLEINSIEISGRIITLGYAAYDTDGLKGIYCPDAGDGARTVKTSGLSTVGSVLGGRVGRVAGEVVNTGVSIAQSRTGERTVSVPAGYNFFIVKKKQN